MNTVIVRNVEIGTGIPKICVPIVGVNKTEIIEAARKAFNAGADIVEWRVDWYEAAKDVVQVEGVLSELREILGELPLLFTFRTANEGGQKEISLTDYAELIQNAVKTGFVDLVDVEIFIEDQPEIILDIIRSAQRNGVKVIGSNHHFDRTPDRIDIVARLCRMQNAGVDIAKIAVMPNNKKDVLTLLAATEEMVSEHARIPVVTMSMAGLGSISRLSGELFGSAITFGTVGQASAPGQMAADELRTVLNIIHKNS